MSIPEKGLAVAKFYMKTCKPCKMLTPITKEVAEENPEVQFVGIDAQENPELSQDLGIRSVPVLIFFRDGEEQSRLEGLQSKEVIQEHVFLLQE
jgi:thioredoxin 1